MKIQTAFFSTMLTLAILNLPLFAQNLNDIQSTAPVLATIAIPAVPVTQAVPKVQPVLPGVQRVVAPTQRLQPLPVTPSTRPTQMQGSPTALPVVPGTIRVLPINQPTKKTRTPATAQETKDTKKKDKKKDKKSVKKAKKREVLPPIITRAQNDSRNPDEKWVALTFDDGPSPEYTPQILEILKQHNIHATFCVVGRQVKKCPEICKQIIADGHKIADHSMNHDERLPWRIDKKIQQEIMGEKTLIESVVPEANVEYYRAPGGVWSAHLRKLLAGWGMKALGWSVDTKDWQKPGVESIVNTVQNNLQNGGVILMHDGGGDRSESVAALKKIIPMLKESGYHFSFPQ